MCADRNLLYRTDVSFRSLILESLHVGTSSDTLKHRVVILGFPRLNARWMWTVVRVVVGRSRVGRRELSLIFKSSVDRYEEHTHQ